MTEALFLVLGLGLVLLEAAFGPTGTSGLLIVLTFWLAAVQGGIALVATAEVSKGVWVEPLKRSLLSLVPAHLLLLGAFLSWCLIGKGIYPWAGHPTAWLNSGLFCLRGALLIALSYLAARWYASRSLEGRAGGVFAVLYLIAFVMTQSLAAFDWVMTLEYPWYSTLLGGYFFVEALFAGIALSGVLCLSKLLRPQKDTLRDVATLHFGFSILWVGLFFAQFLVIWYGNLPEEVRFFRERLDQGPYLGLGVLVLLLLFAGPFLTMLSRLTKKIPGVVALVAFGILLGILLERVFMIGPYARVSIPFFVGEFLLMALTSGFLVRTTLKPQGEPGTAPKGG